MAQIASPPESSESYLLDETGVFLFTSGQRQSRRFSVVAEKIALGSRVEYYNYSTPEPKGFWGYIQIVRRDFIVETIPLEYRRQVLYSWDSYEIEPMEQLRCLVKDSTLLLFDNLVKVLLAGGADAEELGQDRANYILKNAQPRIVPTVPDTGFYYEIESGRGAKVTLIWQDYLTPCENPAGKLFLPSPRAPEKDESGPGGNDGGGTRPTDPPPPDRSADPDSDNAAPPPGDPPIPTPGPPPLPEGVYLVSYRVVQCQRLPSGNFGMVPGNTGVVRMAGPASPSKRPGNPGEVRVGLNSPSGEFNQVGVLSTAIQSPCIEGFVEIVSQALR